LIRLQLFTLLLCSAPAVVAACRELAQGATFWVRLTDPVSSYSARKEAPLRASILESPLCDGAPVFPSGTPVEGRVVSVHKVGLGLRHETASLEFQFERILAGDAAPIAIHARVSGLDNAREKVKNGCIHGIRSTDSPQGRINSRLKHLPALNPYSDWTLIVFKSAFPVFPEPEIYLRSGAELHLELTGATPLPAELTPPAQVRGLTEDDTASLRSSMANVPVRTLTAKGMEADVINLVLAGSREQIEQAFQAAGWTPADRFSRRTFFRQFAAFLTQTSYSNAPMSAQTLDRRLPDLTWQKTLDSYEKRDHVRLWELPPRWNGEKLWAAAAVKETGAELSVRQRRFIHQADRRLDEERKIIVRDFAAAGCIENGGLLPRPELPHRMTGATGVEFETDGNLAVVRLQDCHRELAADRAAPRPAGKIYRYARKQILTFRSDIWRANILYAGYDLTRMAVKALRHSPRNGSMVEAAR
jgi:LssY C-terminus